MLPMLDMWTDVFAVPGKRTTGTKAGSWAVVPPGWRGELPRGVTRIDAPTPYVWIIGRTQTNGPKDYDAVHKIQDGYRSRRSPIGETSRGSRRPEDRPVGRHEDAAHASRSTGCRRAKYFQYAAELMKVNPPHITDGRSSRA